MIRSEKMIQLLLLLLLSLNQGIEAVSGHTVKHYPMAFKAQKTALTSSIHKEMTNSLERPRHQPLRRLVKRRVERPRVIHYQPHVENDDDQTSSESEGQQQEGEQEDPYAGMPALIDDDDEEEEDNEHGIIPWYRAPNTPYHSLPQIPANPLPSAPYPATNWRYPLHRNVAPASNGGGGLRYSPYPPPPARPPSFPAPPELAPYPWLNSRNLHAVNDSRLGNSDASFTNEVALLEPLLTPYPGPSAHVAYPLFAQAGDASASIVDNEHDTDGKSSSDSDSGSTSSEEMSPSVPEGDEEEQSPDEVELYSAPSTSSVPNALPPSGRYERFMDHEDADEPTLNSAQVESADQRAYDSDNGHAIDYVQQPGQQSSSLLAMLLDGDEEGAFWDMPDPVVVDGDAPATNRRGFPEGMTRVMPI